MPFPSSPWQQFSRLMLVNKVITDHAFLKIAKENKELREKLNKAELDFFWYRYNAKRLEKAMRKVNTSGNPEMSCICRKCLDAERLDENSDYNPDQTECKFIAWFKKVIHRLDMTYAVTAVQAGEEVESKRLIEHPSALARWVEDYDSHFTEHHEFNYMLNYGKRLHGARSINDPELAKLRELFKVLHIVQDSDYSSSDNE